MTTSRTLPGLVIAVLVAIALSCVAATVVGLRRDDPAPNVVREPDPRSVAEPRPEVEAAAVLAEWDADRASAWASGDVRRLRSLYAPGSVAGTHDIAMLRRWLSRGLVVRDLHTQVLALRELARTPDRWVLSITDRVVGGVAVGVRGRTALPTDTASTRTVTLRSVGDRWLVASVDG